MKDSEKLAQVLVVFPFGVDLEFSWTLFTVQFT